MSGGNEIKLSFPVKDIAWEEIDAINSTVARRMKNLHSPESWRAPNAEKIIWIKSLIIIIN